MIEENPFEPFRRQDALLSLDKVQLLSPVLPGKIIGVGWNYRVHADELNAEVPEVPLDLLNTLHSLIGPGDSILLPPQSDQVEHEGELAVVIGKRGRWVCPDEAIHLVMGYSIGNDVTAQTCKKAMISGREQRDLCRRVARWRLCTRIRNWRSLELEACYDTNTDFSHIAKTGGKFPPV